MKELLTFPKDFWWGSAWSAEQAEGRGDTGKAKTVWEHWFETEPNRFYEGVGSEITTDHFNRYKEERTVDEENRTKFVPDFDFMGANVSR